MRVIAGELGGRQIVAPKTSGTRPMTDKARAALFNILGSVEGLTVLDTYAGTGALGFEALSRGAARVIGVEVGRDAIQAIRTNVKALGLDWGYTLESTKVETWLAHRPRLNFDLIFAMPPYAVLDRELLGRLGALVAEGGTLVVEYPRQTTEFELEGLKLIDTRSYSDPILAFYRQAS